MKAPDWSGVNGDVWARRWRETDRALGALGAALDQVILEAVPTGRFRALDVGCGPGSTSLQLAEHRSDSDIVGCDVSQSLVAIARHRSLGNPAVRFLVRDAEDAARENGPFDLIFSRHGVMFFHDPCSAFRTLRDSASHGARLVFSCFQRWETNEWAAELASAAAGRTLPSPGREPSGFAFAEPDYVFEILRSSGWTTAEPRELQFEYVAGEGSSAVEQATSFLAEIGPASRVIETMDVEERATAMQRLRQVIERHERGGRIIFQAAAWIWTAAAQ